ncbi:MAG: hypothetical protein JRN39_00130 [Nitrososphaerota archaeon]|nr:hypothetical protein [Nitrososphaerota archaeon]
MEIYVTEAHMGAVAGFMKGYVMIEETKARFKGVIFGRIGGHNVSVKFMPAAVSALGKKGIDADELSLEVQAAIVQGRFETVAGAKHVADPAIGPPGDHKT